jgi:hypothetical protein
VLTGFSEVDSCEEVLVEVPQICVGLLVGSEVAALREALVASYETMNEQPVLPGKVQRYGFSPVWVLRCVFRLKSSENFFLHKSHTYGFSP